MVTGSSPHAGRRRVAWRAVRQLQVPLVAVALLAATSTTAAAAPLADPVEAGRFSFDRSLVLSTPMLTGSSPIIAAGGVREGGLSSLQVVPGTGNRRFLSVSDRGPNGQPTQAAGGRSFPAPGFAPTIYELQADDDGRLSVLSRTQIRVPGTDPLRVAQPGTFPGDPSTITGFRNLSALALDDNMYLQTSDNTIGPVYAPTDPYGLDTEGLQRDPRDGSYWLSDEYRPSIVHLDRSGVMLARIVPTGSGAQDTDATGLTTPLSSFYGGAGQPKLQELLPAEWMARRQNRGLEGVALSADGTKLYAMMQNPLDTRSNADIDPLTAGTQELYKTFGFGPEAGGAGGRCDAVTTGPENSAAATNTNFYRNVRIAELDVSRPGTPVLTGEFIYRLDLQSASNSTVQGRQRVSDIAWAGNRRLIVGEHDDDALAATGSATGRRLAEVDLNAATNLATSAAYDTFSKRAAQVSPGVGGKTVVQPLGCYLDNGTAAELAALPTPVVSAAKSTYLDLGSAPAGVNFNFNKVEGVTLLDGGAGVAVVNDNDFGFAQGDDLQITPAADPAVELRIYASRPSGTAPTVTGTATAGRTLTCTPGTYGGSGALDVGYAWQRGGTAIAGAGASRVTLSTEDIGASITCAVTAARVAGPVRAAALPRTSAATAPVAAFDAGAMGPAGTPGAPGKTGARGPKGSAGARGPLGRVSCKLTRKRGKVTAVSCKVTALKTSKAKKAKVSQAGRALATATIRGGVATLHLSRRTRGTVNVTLLDARGKVLARTKTGVR